MRNLIYKMTKGEFTDTTTSYNVAQSAKANGFKVEAVYQEIPKPLPVLTAKQRARRVEATKPR